MLHEVTEQCASMQIQIDTSCRCPRGGFLAAYPRPYGRTLRGCGVIITSCLIEISGQAEFLPHSRFF
jgi:hypothetical protein